MPLLRAHQTSTLAALAVIGTTQFAVTGVARADEDNAAETGAARTLAVDGLKLAQSGKCDEAIPKLERAEKLHHSPIVLGRLGECQINAGNLVEGTEMLRKVVREPLPPAPSAALSKAYDRAQSVLDVTKPKIAGLTISISGPAPSDLRLSIDGQAVATTLLDTELPANPGDHVVEASAPGYLKASLHVTLSSADKRAVSLQLDPDPNRPVASATAEVSAPEAKPLTTAKPASRGPALANVPAPAPELPSHVAAYVSWGVGLVGVGVGSTFGVIALKDKHDLNDQCSSNVCAGGSRGSVDTAKRAGNISTVAFGVGGAGLILGTVLYFSAGGSPDKHEASLPPRRFAGLSNGRALVGPSSIQLAADF